MTIRVNNIFIFIFLIGAEEQEDFQDAPKENDQEDALYQDESEEQEDLPEEDENGKFLQLSKYLNFVTNVQL